eukprot:SM000042S15342  [mRNA]  locus=s42:460916:465213:- [translate_table: standard]
MRGRAAATALPPAGELDLAAVEYEPLKIVAPRLAGASLRWFVTLLEGSFLRTTLIKKILHDNNIPQVLSGLVIPELPMYLPTYPPGPDEQNVITCHEEDLPRERVALATTGLPDQVKQSTLGSAGEFRYWTIRDYSDAYGKGTITPEMVAENFIRAVEHLRVQHPKSTYFIAVDYDDIRAQAAASTKRYRSGVPLSMLDGVPIAIKDEMDCLPYTTTGGTTWLHKVRPAVEDATCVARLRSCGVVLVGKTNMHEFGSGTTGLNPHYGTPRNPYNMNHYTGGSSSGSAAAVAAGLCPAAIGNDGGGSIRIPASLCGVVGLKGTFGRTTLHGHAPIAFTVGMTGPLTASVADACIVYAAMLGMHPSDCLASRPPLPHLPVLEGCSSAGTSLRGSLKGMKLGKYSPWFSDVADPLIVKACQDALDHAVASYGIEVHEIVIPELEEMRIAHLATIASEMASSSNTDYVNGRRTDFGWDVRGNLALFRSFSSRDYIAAQRIRCRAMRHHLRIFEEVDVIISPTTGMTAPVVPPDALYCGESNLAVTGGLMRFIFAGNLLGFPAVTVPVGQDGNSLPIGLQIMGRPWQEATVLRLAAAIEAVCLYKLKQPSVFYDLLKAPCTDDKVAPSS